jgi:L-fuconate dehydratase
VVFKQLLRLGGVSVPVCPHVGGVGLCELLQHLSMFDYVVVSGSMENRVIEYVDHLHEHFVDPVVIREGRYLAPRASGFSASMHPRTLTSYAYPDGPVWAAARAGTEERGA